MATRRSPRLGALLAKYQPGVPPHPPAPATPSPALGASSHSTPGPWVITAPPASLFLPPPQSTAPTPAPSRSTLQPPGPRTPAAAAEAAAAAAAGACTPSRSGPSSTSSPGLTLLTPYPLPGATAAAAPGADRHMLQASVRNAADAHDGGLTAGAVDATMTCDMEVERPLQPSSAVTRRGAKRARRSEADVPEVATPEAVAGPGLGRMRRRGGAAASPAAAATDAAADGPGVRALVPPVIAASRVTDAARSVAAAAAGPTAATAGPAAATAGPTAATVLPAASQPVASVLPVAPPDPALAPGAVVTVSKKERRSPRGRGARRTRVAAPAVVAASATATPTAATAGGSEHSAADLLPALRSVADLEAAVAHLRARDPRLVPLIQAHGLPHSLLAAPEPSLGAAPSTPAAPAPGPGVTGHRGASQATSTLAGAEAVAEGAASRLNPADPPPPQQQQQQSAKADAEDRLRVGATRSSGGVGAGSAEAPDGGGGDGSRGGGAGEGGSEGIATAAAGGGDGAVAVAAADSDPGVGTVPRDGPVARRSVFAALARSVVYQQLATNAATAIWGRVLRACQAPSGDLLQPRHVLAAPPDQLRAAGLSGRKVEYLTGLAEAFSGREGWDQQLSASTDLPLLVSELTALRGVGTWTVHMVAMFHLGLPDVLPTGDLGVRRGLQLLHELPHLPEPAEVEQLTEVWRPYRSVGSWYMWRIPPPPRTAAAGGGSRKKGSASKGSASKGSASKGSASKGSAKAAASKGSASKTD